MLKSVVTISCFIFFTGYVKSQDIYSATGKASFYANKFSGCKTANGEIFSNKAMTAAHRTLPFGTMVKVTNLKNQKEIIVRINDRGPYVKGRIIDLSRAAADSLDILHEGWTTVKVEEIPEITPAAAEAQAELLPVDSGALKFPDDWIGNWKGQLKIYSSERLKQIVSVQLSIKPLTGNNNWLWTMTYDTSIRYYELIRKDSANNFSIDEKNGISLEAHAFGNHLLTRFSVDGNLLDCDYHLISKDEMSFEIFSGNENRTWTTGNVVQQDDSVPVVNVYPLNVLQEATMKLIDR